MKIDYRCKLLYGPYKMPQYQLGKKLRCGIRGWVQVKRVGEWNNIRIVIAPPPAQSEVSVNGVKYYDFVYNSDDFKARIAKSKFRRMPRFAKSDTGFIGLQGDHGSISFRNIKLRPITSNSGDARN